MARSSARGVWITQGFVAVLLALVVHRYLEAPEDRPRGRSGKAAAEGRRAGPPNVPPQDAGATEGRRSPEELGKDPRPESASSPRRSGRTSVAGAPYLPDLFGTRLVRSDPSFQVWQMDGAELYWVRDNRRQILTADLVYGPESAGGLRIAGIREGSFAAARGLRVGDHLVDINGRVLEKLSDLEDFVEDAASWASGGWRITLERDGATVLIDCRAPAGSGTRRREH